MKRITVLFALLLFVVAVPIALADDVSVGYFGEASWYNGAYTSASVDRFNIYLEHAGEYDYSLMMLDAEVSEHERIGIRFESPNVWRPYLKESRALGDIWVTGRWLVGGVGDGENRFDIFSGCPVNSWLAVEGWGRYQGGQKPDHWLGPKISYGRMSIWYGFNLRGGDDAIVADWQLCKF